MADNFVYCHTPDNNDPDRRIQGLGFFGTPNPNVPQWLPIDTIIALIESGTSRFFVNVANVQTLVIVRQHGAPYYRKYLTTVGDGFPPNNLLNLPQC